MINPHTAEELVNRTSMILDKSRLRWSRARCGNSSLPVRLTRYSVMAT